MGRIRASWANRVTMTVAVATMLHAVTPALHSAAKDADYVFAGKWGGYGSGDGQFHRPAGIAVDRNGNVYVIDQGNHRVQKFRDDGTFVTKWGAKDSPAGAVWGGKGNTEGRFWVPHGIAADQAGNVYVTEWGNHRVQKFTVSGQFLVSWGGQGSTDGKLRFPLGIAVDAEARVYVADGDNKRVQRFASDGTFEANIASYGCFPSDVCVDSKGAIYVADATHRLWKFGTDGEFVGWAGSGARVEDDTVRRTGWFGPSTAYSLKTHTGFWSEPGSNAGQFREPRGIALAGDNAIFVADSRNHRVQRFDHNSQFLTMWGSKGTGDGQFRYPYDVAVDSQGCVYVTDRYNHRVQKFSPVLRK